MLPMGLLGLAKITDNLNPGTVEGKLALFTKNPVGESLVVFGVMQRSYNNSIERVGFYPEKR